MRKIMVATAMALVAFAANAQQSNFTGPNGQYQGSTYNYGRSTTFTDRNGQFSGSSIQNGNTTNFYDRNGHFTRSVTRPSTDASSRGTDEIH